MSITTELAQVITPRPGTCGSCAAGLVFLPDGTGRYETHSCPCTETTTVEYVAESDAPIPDPQNIDTEE